jgi:thiamine biosynthesis lipoprotein
MRWRTTASLLLLVYGFEIRQAPARFEFTETHMGTQFRIVIYAATAHAANLASQAALERIAQLDAIMSDYRETSELMLLSRSSGGPAVAVSNDLFRVLAKAQELAEKSQGAFDITIGPVVRLWRRARRTGELPDTQRLSEAMRSTGYQKMYLDHSRHTVSLKSSGMLLDLGGIAKGYAADEAMRVLKQHRIRQALVAAGGDIVVSAPPTGEAGWVIGIAPLESTDTRPSRYLLLRDSAVSTSGDAHQYVEIGGVRYSHIVDPRTGLGMIGRKSVTVVAGDCTTSDSLATAAAVLGDREGAKLIDSTPGAAALFVGGNEEGGGVVETRRWKNLPKAGAAQIRNRDRGVRQ